MAARPKTFFDRYFHERMNDPAFAAEYRAVRGKIDAIDKLIGALDTARLIQGLSKAELARKVGAQPEMMRRLLTAPRGSPTMATVLKVAQLLGYHLELVPDGGGRGARRAHARRRHLWRSGRPMATRLGRNDCHWCTGKTEGELEWLATATGAGPGQRKISKTARR